MNHHYYQGFNAASPKTEPAHETIHFYSDDEVTPTLRQRNVQNPQSFNLNESKSYVTSTPEYVSRRLHFASSDDSGLQSDLWSDISSPLLELHSKWQRSNRGLYDTSVSQSFLERLKSLLPFIIGVIVLSGAVYSVQLALNSSRDVEKVSGKYAAILYAHKRVYNSTNPSRVPLGDVLDESGNVLSGKRAAIQFGYDRRSGKAPVESNHRVLEDPLPIKVEEAMPNYSDEKKEVVRKVASFGHFASSKADGAPVSTQSSGQVIRKKRPVQEEEEVKEEKVEVKQEEEEPQKKKTTLEPIDLDEVSGGAIKKVVPKYNEPQKTPNKPLSRLIEK